MVSGNRESPGWGEQCGPGWWRLRDGAPPAALGVGTLIRGRMASASTFVWEEAASLPDARQFSLPPNDPAAIHMLELRQSEFEQVCVQAPLKGTGWDSRSTPSLSALIPTHFYIQKSQGLLFLALDPWAAGPGLGLGPSLSREHLHSQDTSPEFHLPHGVGPACSVSPPFLPVSMWLLLKSLVVGPLSS